MDKSLTVYPPQSERDPLLPHPDTPDGSSDHTVENSEQHQPREGTENIRSCASPRQRKQTLLLLSLAMFFAGCDFAVIAPFYSKLADKKGMTKTVQGFVFSTFELAMFLFSPIYGIYLTQIGAKFLYVSGILVGSVCCILFGALYLCPEGLPFVVLSFATRCVEAAGLAANVTAAFAIISNMFPRNVASIFAILETFQGIGLMVGPGIGGALEEVGGFGLPFFVLGCATLVNGVMAWAFLPPPLNTEMSREGSVWTLLRSPLVIVTALSIVAGAVGITFIDPTLGDHLRQFGLSDDKIGLVFMIGPGLYALTSPLWGYICDKLDMQAPLMVIGNLTCAVAFLFIGPFYYIPFLPTKLWVTALGLALYGLSIGCALVPTMKCLIIGAHEMGFPENLETFGVVAGLFNSVFNLGAFIGPTMAGALTDHLGFQKAVGTVTVVFCGALLTNFVFFFGRRCRRQRHGEPPVTPTTAYRKSSDDENSPAAKENDSRQQRRYTYQSISDVIE